MDCISFSLLKDLLNANRSSSPESIFLSVVVVVDVVADVFVDDSNIEPPKAVTSVRSLSDSDSNSNYSCWVEKKNATRCQGLRVSWALAALFWAAAVFWKFVIRWCQKSNRSQIIWSKAKTTKYSWKYINTKYIINYFDTSITI